MRNKCIKTKRGAASFYIVAFSTLILMVIATSFAMVVITEVSRSANDDLSQSAYDSALAGIEDAKVAFSNYRRCREAGVAPGVKNLDGGDSKTISCNDIIYWMEHPDCNMVGHILGKIPKNTNDLTEVLVGGVEITDSDGKNSTTNQAYTCVTIDTELNDYRMTLGSKKQQQIVKLQTGRVDSQGHTIDDDVTNVSKIRISWASTQSDENNYLKYLTNSGFPTAAIVYNPPIVEVQLVQTSNSFTMQSFDEVVGKEGTNRGTLYLIPEKSGSSSVVNQIGKDKMVKSNNRMQTNEPVVVSCPEKTTSDFHCVAEIEIPEPIPNSAGDKTRNNNTFMMAISLPYQKPSTDFSIELICSNGKNCGNVVGKVNPKDENSDNIVKLKNTQVSIDSTGRANDLYRRVETRVETSDSTFDFDYPYYPLQVLGGAVSKKMAVLQEGSFHFLPYN